MDRIENEKELPLGFKLYLIVDDALKYVQEKLSEKYNLERKSFLYIVFAEYEKGLNQDKLSNYLGIDKSTVGRMIDKLVERDLLIRKQDPDNKRANKIFVTEKGSELNVEILELIHEWRENATAKISADTIEETKKFIDFVLQEKRTGGSK